MKLLVCFKVVSDLDQMLAEDYRVNEAMQIDTSYVRTMLNCFDESCLEYGLRLAEEAAVQKIPMPISALTVGDRQADLYLKTLGALHYNHIIRLEAKEQVYLFHPEQTAGRIAAYLETSPQDIILMGRQAPSGNHFAVPQMVAERLHLPLVANVWDLHLLADGLVQTVSEVGGVILEQIIQLPAVFTIGNAMVSKLRVPSLKERMAYQGQIAYPDKEYEGKCIKESLPEQLIPLDQSRAGIRIQEGEIANAIEAIREQLSRV